MSVELTSVRAHSDDGTDEKAPPYNTHSQAYDNTVFEDEVLQVDEVYVIENNGTYTVNAPDKTSTGGSQNEDNDDDDDDDDDDSDDETGLSENGIKLLHFQKDVYESIRLRKELLWTIFLLVLAVLYCYYFGRAMYHRFGDEGSYRLLVGTLLAVLLIIGITLWRRTSEARAESWKNHKHVFKSKCWTTTVTVIKWLLRIIVFLAIITYVIYDAVTTRPTKLISVAGIIIYILLLWVTSTNPARVNWHTVFWGLAMQYIFALIIIKWDFGFQAFKWLGDRITEVINYALAGSAFLFDDGLGSMYQHYFAFVVLPIVIFFSSLISVLYYIGAMQFVIKSIGRFLSFCLGTSPAESINAAGNIFIGMTEAPLMIRPFIQEMTKSELHAVMTGGFATIAGSVLGVYISYGAPANHLLSASVMSAPAALAMSKISCPETKPSKGSSRDYDKMGAATEQNIIEAASLGAIRSVKLVANIAVCLVAFLSLLAFTNATLVWFGERVGLENFTLEFICSYVFYPISFFMGVEGVRDCRKVAELVGIKTFTNEFVAYSTLKVLVQNKENLTSYTSMYGNDTWWWDGDNIFLNSTNAVLVGGVISEHSRIIATYALCGFANIGSMGILLGGLSAMAPSKTRVLSKIVLRAMIAGNVACFLTACIAGLLLT